MKRISEPQLQALEALNMYRFLSVKQMIRLGISGTKYGISKHLKGLQAGKKPLVHSVDFGTFPTIGTLPVLYYLTKHGAEWLAEAFQIDSTEINYPKGGKIFSRDYFHRVGTIDLHLSARQFADSIEGMAFDFFHTYFEFTGSNHSKNKNAQKLTPYTKIQLKKVSFVPDSIFSITDPHGKQWLFTAEVYRNHTTKRTHQQLKHHVEALENGIISYAYQTDRATRVLVICEEERAMKALQKRLAEDEDFEDFEAMFLFKTDQQVKENFPAKWQSFTGREMNCFMA